MSRGQLRQEVEQHFGAFLRANNFQAVDYDYNDKFFGNEIFELESGDIALRFVRDRGQVFLDLKGAGGPLKPLNYVLRNIQWSQLPPEDLRDDWAEVAKQLSAAWPRLCELLRKA